MASDQYNQTYNQYKTHFYCALCGGPFAQVYRTATATAVPSVSADADISAESAFNIPVDENVQIPEEVVLGNMGYAASRHREHRIKATEKGMRRGIMSERRQAWRAYDGRRISTAQMEWTRNLIALIHERAKHVPELGRQYFQEGVHQFLTGKGRIRQVNAWADAHHDYDEENDVLPPTGQQDDGQNGFQVYQEFGRLDSEFIISSIPFHHRCWGILCDAIDVSAEERGLNVEDDPIDDDLDLLWGHLRGLVGMSAAARWLGHSESILSGPTRGEVVTRLGEVDYREAQGSGEGYQWRHDEGLHWVTADPEPSATRFVNEPLMIVDASDLPNRNRQPAPFETYRQGYQDCFHLLPTEIVVEVFRYLTSTDIFSLKQASASAYCAEIPMLMYKRFMQEEFEYYPPVAAAVEKYEGGKLPLKDNQRVDWKGSFERLRKAIRTPESLGTDGQEWDAIDINLKNRNRIWKIVKPLAEEYVETCPASLRQKYGATRQIAQRTSVVRGCVGTRSGREGVAESAYFGYTRRAKNETTTETVGDDDDESEEAVVANELLRVRVYRGFLPEFRDIPKRNPPDYAVCGLEFLTMEDGDDIEQTESRRFGRRSPYFEDIDIGSKHLIGFVFCFTENVVGGIRLVFHDNTFSRPIGKWDGGVMRKVVAPPDYRTLVGVTGFINSSGFIEKIGLLEETLPRNERDVFGALPVPPLQVDLSHDESSVWDRLPPTNVRFLEREGQNVRNWRLHKAQWEIWSKGYREDGDLKPNSRESAAWAQKSLREIVGFYDKDCLRGLTFIYDTPLGRREFTIGSSKATMKGRLAMSPKEEISAVVICFDVNGVTGILFMTDRGRTSQVFGPRYVGTHKVFGPLLAAGKKSTHHRHDLQGVRAVVGLHCLFDYETGRFLQLGLIIPEEDDDTVAAVATLRPIPFDEIDENCLQWEDIPLPRELMVQRPSEDLLSNYSRDVNLTGWVDLTQSVKKIVISNHMKGIRFVFSDANIPDKYFGDIEEDDPNVYEQVIDGAKIFGVFTLEKDDGDQDECYIDIDDDQMTASVSSINDERKELPQLWFLTDQNRDPPGPAFPEVKEDKDLRGLKFDFSAKKLHSWRPIFSAASEVKFPWDKNKYKINQPLRNTCAMAFKLFGDLPPDQHGSTQISNEDAQDPVDAVKGYITREGLFCGLTFRRVGNWCEDVFGARSAFEIIVELAKGEEIVSAWISGTSAISLVTSTGRCTPWFGKVKNPKEIQGPSDQVAVGVYGAVESSKLDRVDWSALGLLYPRSGTATIRTNELVTPMPLKFFETDIQTNLPWFSDINQKPPTYELATMASGKVPVTKRERIPMRLEGIIPMPAIDLWRAYTAFDPQELEQVRFYVNRDLANKGLRAMRLRGTVKMGLLTVGEWCYGNTVVKRSEKMRIEGPDGERITRMQVWYQKLNTEDRVVGMVIVTSTGRQKRMFAYEEAAVKRDPTHVQPVSVWLDCKPGYEVVGFHGIFSTHFMHDIGLVLRPIGESGPMARKNGIGGASSRTSCHSHSGMSESTYTDATAVSPDSSGNGANPGGDHGQYIHSPSPRIM